MTERERTEAAVRAYLSAVNAGDPERIAACVTEDFLNEHASSAGRPTVGRHAYRERLGKFLREFRELHYEIEDVIVDGERAVVPYVVSADWFEGGKDDAVPRRISLRGIFRFRVAEGLIAHRVDYWDFADFQRQAQGS